MVYHKYTLRGTRDVPYGWRCPKCGNLCVSTYRVTSASSYDDRGFLVKLEERKAKAQDLLEQSMETTVMNTVLDVENKRFNKVRLNGKCPKCGEAPAWSNLPLDPPDLLVKARKLSLAAAIILFVIWLFAGRSKQPTLFTGSIVAAGLFAVLLAASLLTRHFRYKAALPAIEATPPESLPRMAATGPELLNRLAKEGVLKAQEADQAGVPAAEVAGGSTGATPSSANSVYRDMAAQRRKKQLTKRIVAALIVAAIAAIVIGVRVSKQNLERWQTAMAEADLFTVDPEAGEKFVVYEVRNNRSGVYQKAYLPGDQVAAAPEDAGYIVTVEDSEVSVGSYGGSISLPGRNGLPSLGSSLNREIPKGAYQIHTLVRLYDRHTGLYVGETIELLGGDPPSSIKSYEMKGVGSRPGFSQLTNAVHKLIRKSEDGTTGDGE